MLWSIAIAWACPPTGGEVARARAAFDDAEVELAGAVLEQAVAQLGCQTSVVDPQALLELYRLDGLVQLSRLDEKSAVYATIRAVTVDPEAPPPASYGPDLAALYAVWSDRLRSATAVVEAEGGGTVFVDGRPLAPGERRSVLQGEHVIQVLGPGGLRSEVRDLTGDLVVRTGIPAAPTAIGPEQPAPIPPPRVERPGRRRPAPLWIAGAASLAVGGGLLGVAIWQDEVVFANKVWPDPQAVDRAASQVRIAYIAGYGFAGLGTGLIATNAVGFPMAAGVRLRW